MRLRLFLRLFIHRTHQDRVGGRIWSYRKGDAFGELGAMVVTGLCKLYSLVFPTRLAYIVYWPVSRFYSFSGFLHTFASPPVVLLAAFFCAAFSLQIFWRFNSLLPFLGIPDLKHNGRLPCALHIADAYIRCKSYSLGTWLVSLVWISSVTVISVKCFNSNSDRER